MTIDHIRRQQPLGTGKAAMRLYDAFRESAHAHTPPPKEHEGQVLSMRGNRRPRWMPSSRAPTGQGRAGRGGAKAAEQRWETSDLNPAHAHEEAIEANRAAWEQQKRREARDLSRHESEQAAAETSARQRYIDSPHYPGDPDERYWSDTDPESGKKFPARGYGPFGKGGQFVPKPHKVDPRHEEYAQSLYQDVPDKGPELPSDPQERRRYVVSRSPSRRAARGKEVRGTLPSETIGQTEYERKRDRETYKQIPIRRHEGVGSEYDPHMQPEHWAGEETRSYRHTDRGDKVREHHRRLAAGIQAPFLPIHQSEFQARNPYLFNEGIVAQFRYGSNGKDPIPQPPPKPEPDDDFGKPDYGDPNPWKNKKLPSRDEHEGRIRNLEKTIKSQAKASRAKQAGLRRRAAGTVYPLLTLGRMLHKPPAGESSPPTGFHEFRSKRDYKKNKRNTNKTPHATKGRKGKRPPRRPGLTARKSFADWHDWFPDEKTTQKEWKSWYPDDRSSPPSGNFFEFMAKSRRHQKNVRKAAKGEAGMTHTGKHLGGAGGKKPKQGESEPMLTGGPKTTMGKGGVVRMLTPGELQGQRKIAKEQTRSSLSKRRKKEILDQLRAEGKLHEFGLPAIAAGIATAAPYVVKGAKVLWKGTKWGAKKGVGLGAAAVAGAAASKRGRGGARPGPSGTRPRSLMRTATRSQPDAQPNSRGGVSRAGQRGVAEERKQAVLKNYGKQQHQSNLGRRGEGKREVERR